MNHRPDSGSGPLRGATRTLDSQTARPFVHVAALVAALVVLGLLGRAASAGAFGRGMAAEKLLGSRDPAGSLASPPPSGDPANQRLSPPTEGAETNAPPAAARVQTATDSASPPAARTAATPDSPVVLNTADVDDLRRLPGVGNKRASAILALREKLGRFRAVEDLLKVKGIGRTTLKRLRPLVRLDAQVPDAGPSSDPATPKR